MNKSALDQYAVLKTQIAALEVEADTLKPQIIEEMQKEEADQVEHEAGLFSLQSRRTWTYPKPVQDIEVAFKQLKADSEADGSATYVEKPVLMFKANK